MKAFNAIMTGKAAALSAVLCLALCAAARPPERQKVKYTPEELTRLRAEAHQKMLERTGGYVMKPGVGRGMVMFFNAQTRVAESNIVKVASSLVRPLRIKVAVERIEGAVTSADAGTRLKKSGAAAGVFVVDDVANPNTLLVAPEGRWAIVNVAALAADGAAEPFVVARTQKEAMRAFLFAFNAGDSQSENSLMGPIAAPKELDLFPAARPPVDVLNRAIRAMPNYGVQRWERYTYRDACQEGWAPAPTNDYQKAIWNEVRSLPQKPITIEFDPKQGK